MKCGVSQEPKTGEASQFVRDASEQDRENPPNELSLTASALLLFQTVRMKKPIFTFAILVAIHSLMFSQNTEVELLFGYQEHDKRFSRIYEGINDNEGNWGTSYLGFAINRNILQSGKFRFNVGLGYARETNTYLTPYDHCFDRPGQPCSEALTFIDRYSIDMVLASFTPKFKLAKNLDMSMSIVPEFYFYKKVNGFGVTSDFDLGLYAIEFIPELEYRVGNMNIGLGLRIFQMKAIDKVYLYGNKFLTENPGYLNRTFDTYNPTKLVLSLAYQISKF